MSSLDEEFRHGFADLPDHPILLLGFRMKYQL